MHKVRIFLSLYAPYSIFFIHYSEYRSFFLDATRSQQYIEIMQEPLQRPSKHLDNSLYALAIASGITREWHVWPHTAFYELRNAEVWRVFLPKLKFFLKGVRDMPVTKPYLTPPKFCREVGSGRYFYIDVAAFRDRLSEAAQNQESL